jgi:hypothetical protein
MRSEATSVEDYLADLADDRQQAMTVVRRSIVEALPTGLEETMAWGMIAYVVPLETFADTYNGQPLLHTALASQKNYMSLYLHGIYGDPQLREIFEADYRATGKRYDVGKSCVRFRRLEDLPLDVVGRAIEGASVEQLIAQHESAMAGRKSGRRKRVP